MGRSSCIISAILLALFCLTPKSVNAQDEERVGSERPSPRIMIVVDVSSSMKTDDKITKAIEWAIANIVEPQAEDAEIGIITFNHIAERFVYEEEVDGEMVTREWFKLPAAPALDALKKALRTLGTSGTTNPDEALEMGFRSGPQSLVLLTDGEFDHTSSPESAVTEAQEWAKQRKLRLPMFVILGVHVKNYQRERVEELAKLAHGSVWYKEPEVRDSEWDYLFDQDDDVWLDIPLPDHGPPKKH